MIELQQRAPLLLAREREVLLLRQKDEEGLGVMRRFKAVEEEKEQLKRNEKSMIEKEKLKEVAKERGFQTPEASPKQEEEEAEEEKGKSDATKITLSMMMKVMERMIEKEKGEVGGLAETVRYGGGGLTLPMLPEWNAQSAPLDLGDWLTLVESHMGDLSATSHEWSRSTMPFSPGW